MNAGTRPSPLRRAFLLSFALSIKLLIDLPMMLLGFVVFWLAYPFKYYHAPSAMWHFPRWAWAWDNADHGIEGQSFFQGKTPGWALVFRCFVWTCLRNPTFNFGKYLLGISGRQYERHGDAGIGDKKKGGAYWITTSKPWLFEYYRIVPYTALGSRRCIRIRAGWKLEGKEASEVCQFCFVFNPVMSYSGE